MNETGLKNIIELITIAVELVGIAVIIGGAIVSAALFARAAFRDPPGEAYRQLRSNLGRSLNIEVVAEGVEKSRQAAFLRANGCDTGQGFLFGRAMPAEAIPVLLERTPARAAGS